MIGDNIFSIKYVTHDSQAILEIHTILKKRIEELSVVWGVLDMHFQNVKFPVELKSPWDEFWGGQRCEDSFSEFCRDNELMSQLVSDCSLDRILRIYTRSWSKTWGREGNGMGEIDMVRFDIPLLIYTYCVGRRLSVLPIGDEFTFTEFGSVPVFIDDAFYWGSSYGEPRLPAYHQVRVDEKGETPILPLAVSSAAGATFILYEDMLKNIFNNFLLYKLDHSRFKRF